MPVERKRATTACQGCRARKIRCDVITKLPCIRCRLERINCVMTKQSNSNSSRNSNRSRATTTIEQLQQPAPSASIVPTLIDCQDQFQVEEEDALDPSVLTLWAEESPAFQSDTVELGFSLGLNLSPQDDAALQAGFLQSSLDIMPLPAPHVHTDPQLPASDVLPIDLPNDPIPSSSPSIGSCKLSHLSDEDLNYLIRKGVFSLPPQPAQESFFKAYFLFIHPFLPVLAEDEAWSDYSRGLRKISLLLHRSMLFAACPFVSVDDVRQLGYSSLAEAQESLFDKARLLFDFETEDDKFAVVGAALLLSYRSPRAHHQTFQRAPYWLALATSIIKETSHHHEKSSTDTMKSWNPLKRLQWACAVREFTISLSTRKIIDTEPGLLNLSTLHIEDVWDSTLYSKVYDKETKLTLARMFLSLTELTKLVAKIRTVKHSVGYEPDLVINGDKIVESLFNVDRASFELSKWRETFTDHFSVVTTASTSTNLKMLVFHRNLALLLCDSILVTLNQPHQAYFNNSSEWSRGMVSLLEMQWERAKHAAAHMTSLITEIRSFGLGPCLPITMSPIAINSGLIHTLQRPIQQFTQSSEREESVKLCVDVLEELEERFPVVNDLTTMMYAAIQFSEQEVAAYSMWKSTSANFGDSKDLLSGHDQDMIIQEADIISRTIHFLDQLFSKGEPVLSLNHLTRQAFFSGTGVA